MTTIDVSALKSALLRPKNTIVTAEIFGTTVYLRRMTAGELIDHEEALRDSQIAEDARKASELSVQLIVDCLVHPDGSLIAVEDKPTATELLQAHDNVALLDAIAIVKKHALGKLEDAEKN
ncbi:TPA: phage tail protein [Enterobacter bugandensis]|uniref:phage tail protein n=1 Tax=Enterobacter bugandensis TaxID=881260 RepID=UPI00244C5E4E|nr:phage tail protein [Enterobacter bugandensis]EJC0563806.1 phage tail protein [Enterobacter cloacae]MDH0087749.1 phage tail protein [Enterobacter bugandensis]MDH0108830.1 phage tail protein [Enterobacter bugandensis]MDH0129599.1 phage tail protein [Enterobacter bugandensis]HDR2693168.1 phage tail protein [Enterobacter bugandensis]